MSIKVLVVDDSAFFRRRLSELLTSDRDITVIGEAGTGREAVEQAARLKPDVITMDIEMPQMDGISATREIMAQTPLPILMLSAATNAGARATLDALEAGAMDFMPKRFDGVGRQRETARQDLCQRIHALSGRKPHVRRTGPGLHAGQARPAAAIPEPSSVRRSRHQPLSMIAIGASTGGPVALQKILTGLPATLPVPVVVIQHMPAAFTSTFAERLNHLSPLNIHEVTDQEYLRAGGVYIAPGGRQMLLEKGSQGIRCRLRDAAPGETFKPSVDIAFSSLAAFCDADVLAIVLTGMGNDGCAGAAELKRKGATIWAQDQATSVVYGMPAAIAAAGLADQILPLDQLASQLQQVH